MNQSKEKYVSKPVGSSYLGLNPQRVREPFRKLVDEVENEEGD